MGFEVLLEGLLGVGGFGVNEAVVGLVGGGSLGRWLGFFANRWRVGGWLGR